MAAYKDEARGTWYVSFYDNDQTGKKETVYMLVQTIEKMQADIHKMYDEIIETGQIKEKESPVDGEAYTDIEELQHDYLAMIKTVVDMLDGAKYLWQKQLHF